MLVETFSPQRSAMLAHCLVAEGIFTNQPNGKIVEKPYGVINMRELGLNKDVLHTMTRYSEALDVIIQMAARKQEEVSLFLHRFLTEDAKTRLGINTPFPDTEPFPRGSVLRLDSVLTKDSSSPVRICDVNASLLGYAVQRRTAELTTQLDPKMDIVAQNIGQEAAKDSANIILTNKKYKAKPHLDWIAKRIKEISEKPFMTMSDMVFLDIIGYKGFDDLGLIINQSRETIVPRYKQTRPTIYGKMAKLIETKLFPRVLPEIMDITDSNNSDILQVAEKIAIPSRLLWMMGTDMSSRIDQGDINKHPFGQPIETDDLENFLSSNTGKNWYKCVLKTTDSSGSQGVRVVEGKSWNDLSEKIHLIGNQMTSETSLPSYNRRNPGVLVLQPFYDSTIELKGQIQRVKIDTFMQKTEVGWQVIGLGAQIKPDSHTIVHGGKDTNLLVVADSWVI